MGLIYNFALEISHSVSHFFSFNEILWKNITNTKKLCTKTTQLKNVEIKKKLLRTLKNKTYFVFNTIIGNKCSILFYTDIKVKVSVLWLQLSLKSITFDSSKKSQMCQRFNFFWRKHTLEKFQGEIQIHSNAQNLK